MDNYWEFEENKAPKYIEEMLERIFAHRVFREITEMQNSIITLEQKVEEIEQGEIYE